MVEPPVPFGTMVPCTDRGFAGTVDNGRTSTRRTGDPPSPGRIAISDGETQRRARQLTSQAERAAARHPVFRPSLHATPQQRALGRNLALDLMAAIGVGVTMALISTLLPTIARRGALEPIGLAAIAAAPFVANLLGAFAGQVGPRSPRHLALIRAAGAASLLLLA